MSDSDNAQPQLETISTTQEQQKDTPKDEEQETMITVANARMKPRELREQKTN